MTKNGTRFYANSSCPHAHPALAHVRNVGCCTEPQASIAVGQQMPGCYCFQRSQHVGTASLLNIQYFCSSAKAGGLIVYIHNKGALHISRDSQSRDHRDWQNVVIWKRIALVALVCRWLAALNPGNTAGHNSTLLVASNYQNMQKLLRNYQRSDTKEQLRKEWSKPVAT